MDTETMVDIEKKLARLAELENKVEKIKVSNRERVSAYMDRKRQAGMVQISALISKQAYEIINNRRDKSILAGRQPETVSSIIERALLSLDNTRQDSVKDNININDSIKQDIESQEPEQSESFSLSPVDEVDVPEYIPAPKNYQNEIDTLIEETQAKMVEPPEQDILTRIKDMKAQKISYERMAEIFNAEGLKTIRQKPYTRENIESFYRRQK